MTFLEPVGALPLLESNDAEVTQIVQGQSTLDGSFVHAYEGQFTNDIPFDASASHVKGLLEVLRHRHRG